MARWHSCNVLRVAAQTRQLWHFDARSGDFVLNRQQAGREGEALPAHLGAKTWRTLWQPRLNVAWLPSESVFLRVARLPQSSFDETLAMVELQLEKLSPIPVTQVAWSLQVLPHATGNLQTVIVILVERTVVEEFLGLLEGHGYLADRLEIPMLDQLQATPIKGDGAWIYPEACGGKGTALVAWWFGGALQSLDFLMLPAVGDGAASLKEQLTQMAWAGEMEGWLATPPAWHLVADPAAAAEWEPALRQGLDEPVAVTAPLNPAQLAALTAKRAANAEPKSNLLPPEFAARYQQRFVDRLWMRGLGAVGVLYLVAIAIYFGAVQVVSFNTRGVEKQVADLGQTYTNALQLKARYQVLKDRQELKFAALDCWKATAELMPEGITLDSLSFGDGRKLSLNGTAPSDKVTKLLNFNAQMRKAAVNNQPLFDPTKNDAFSYRANPGQGTVSWNFALELKRVEEQ